MTLVVWTGNKLTGQVKTKDSYAFIAHSLSSMIHHWRHKKVWKWNIPLNLKWFIWLCCENGILTWDNLTTRGWIGPSIWNLYKLDSESIFHLFVSFSFCKLLWKVVLEDLHCSWSWGSTSFVQTSKIGSCLIINKKICVSIILCGEIWKSINLAIFEGKVPSVMLSNFEYV